ncbi:MAG: DNA cytosine methyltransferase, partial [Treponema sp.]|nr:DNA cytosine methyltransferase [Treponema sp.]
SRERVYFVALREDLALDYEPPKETGEKIFLKDILNEKINDDILLKRNDIKIYKNENDIDYMPKPIKIGIVNKGGQGERIYSAKGHAITQSAYGGGVGAKTGLYLTAQGIRRLTIGECKKAMGFPDEHIVGAGVQGYQQLGNAVIPRMIGLVFDGIKGR